jgi:hypothetical protein
LRRKINSNAIATVLFIVMLIGAFAELIPSITYAQPPSMTFTTGERIEFTSTTEMQFKTGNAMQFWSGVQMKFQTNVSMQFIELDGNGVLAACDMIQIHWPAGYIPPPCSWWEVIDPTSGRALGEIHIDYFEPPYFVHIDMVWPGPVVIPPGGVIIPAKKKIDIIEPCSYFEVHWPSHWWPQPGTWWEIMDPETGEATGYEFHVDWTNESCEFHVDIVIPEPYVPPAQFPVYEIWARRKIPEIVPCDYFVVEEPPGWWPQPCTWWEIIDPFSGEPTGYEFHVDWNNESCEFHVDRVIPEPFIIPEPGALYVTAEEKVVNITRCMWFEVTNPVDLPGECTWWEILDPTGAPTGKEFHVDATDGITRFHIDGTMPDIIITIPPTYIVTTRQKIDIIERCIWYKVEDPTTTPVTCTWWEVLDPTTGEPTGWEFHVDEFDNVTGWFHVDNVIPGPTPIPPTHILVAEKKIDDIQPCDWFKVIDPNGWVPQPCSWWQIIWPRAWNHVTIHVDNNDGDTMFHVDAVVGGIEPISPPPYNVTAIPYEPPPPPWYIKPPYRDYAPSGMPDFDQRQDAWGPGVGIYTWCGPVAVANSLWWLDSEFEPSPIPPPTINDNFPLVTSYNAGGWDDHDPRNVNPFVRDLAWHMDTDGIRTLDGHTGTRWPDMEFGIKQYLIQQGVETQFEVHNYTFPDFYEIEREIEICQDVVLFLEFYLDTGQGEWIPLYDNPSLEYGHYVTCAGVNSTRIELLISDPIQDAFESGATPGHSPIPHPYPHTPDVHNDTKYVSHDAYRADLWIAPPKPYPSPYGVPVWELVGYLQTLGYPPEWHAFIPAAVVTSPLGVHDVAVTNVTSAKDVICQGCLGNISVTVENQGDFAEVFNVTAYANTTVIGEKTVSLASHTSTGVVFTWNATGWSKGNYTLKAEADIVSGETDTADNTYIDDWVIISMLGDITGSTGYPDGVCDMRDVGLVARYFGQSVPPAPPNCDVVYDGVIDMRDIGTVARHFGETDP